MDERKASIPTTVPLLDAETMERLRYDPLRDNDAVPTLSEVRTTAATYASTGRAIYQPLADLVAGQEVSVEHLHDVALWACSLDGSIIRDWLDMTVPLFEHDCEGCVYLGAFDGRDLYYCDGEPTVISRNSSDGGDYSSGLCFAEGPHAMPRLAEALRRARTKGLCS